MKRKLKIAIAIIIGINLFPFVGMAIGFVASDGTPLKGLQMGYYIDLILLAIAIPIVIIFNLVKDL